jgi:hypothetical protein
VQRRRAAIVVVGGRARATGCAVRDRDRRQCRRDFMPSAWHLYVPTFWDFATLAGSIGVFVLLFLGFLRVLPAISIAEMRKLARDKADAHA